MATRKQNIPPVDPDSFTDARDYSFGIAVAEWNRDITAKLLEGAKNALLIAGVPSENILVKWVPGSFELTAGAKYLAESDHFDAIICLGCVIQGETPHFTYICEGISYGITELNLRYDIPFVFGVLTTNSLEQARERSGGKKGNKGEEAAITAIRMAQLKKELNPEPNEEDLL